MSALFFSLFFASATAAGATGSPRVYVSSAVPAVSLP